MNLFYRHQYSSRNGMATGAAQFLQRSKPKTTVVDAMSIMCSYKCEAQSIGDRIMF
jgi:hypothetical protein